MQCIAATIYWVEIDIVKTTGEGFWYEPPILLS